MSFCLTSCTCWRENISNVLLLCCFILIRNGSSPEHIKIGFFENNVDLRYQDEVHGDLFSQVNQTIAVLKAKYLKAWIHFMSKPVGIEKDWGSTTPITTPEQILALLRIQPSISSTALAAKIGISRDGVKYHLGKMISTGLIRHVGLSRSGHWEVLK